MPTMVRGVSFKNSGQPLCQSTAGPVLARAGGWADLIWRTIVISHICAESGEAGFGCSGTGVVDTDMACEYAHVAVSL